MNYKKKYKEALANARQEYTTTENVERKQWLEELFPELAESEDERIRKALIRFHKSTIDIDGIKGDRIIAWLEKQKVADEEIIFRPAAGTDIRIAAKQALEKIEIGKEVVLAFNGAYIPVNGKTVGEIDSEYDAWLEKQGHQPSAIRWYDVSLIPQEMEELLVEWNSEDATWHEIAFYHPDTKTFWNGTRQVENVTRWCYIIDLLEKQGEQKPTVVDFNAKDWYVSKVDGKLHDMTYNPADKVEPKFKVGDWINGYYTNYKVTAISNKGYVVEDTDGNKMNILFENEKFHNLWTIQDAKDVDVLIDKNYMGESPFIFKETKPSNIKTDVPNPLTVLGYCGIGGAGFTKSSGWGDTANCIYYPATKEQRELLFKKMKEAGYEWDAEKKKLKKIKDEIEIPFGAKDSELQEVTYCIPKGFHAEIDDDKVVIKKGEKSAAWSEEDEERLQSCLKILQAKGIMGVTETINTKWLKSLKDRYTWKPSEEQMYALRFVKKAKILDPDERESLDNLYRHLKKLKE